MHVRMSAKMETEEVLGLSSPAQDDSKEGEKGSSLNTGIGNKEEVTQATKLKVASMYETQSESELLALCGHSSDVKTDGGGTLSKEDGDEETSGTPQVNKKTGRLKRKERRLRNEPQNITGEEGPAGIHVLDFAEARATELCSMVKAMASKGGSKRTFQELPKHMRRRAMSHNVKRLPRRLRALAAKEMEKTQGSTNGTSKKKKGSRKQRRKRTNLQSVYAQRQRDNKWLETHLWHAKRMKMCNKYGYRLAEHCNDKGVKAAYMSLTHGCLLSDISYYCCIEVTGVQSHVVASLSPLFSSDTGLTIGGKAYLNGQREGKAVVYRCGQYPHAAIGPVQFLWQALPPHPKGTPQPDVQKDKEILTQCEPRSLWVWCHPAMHCDLLSEVNALVAIYNAKKHANSSQSDGHHTGDPSLLSKEEGKTDLVSVRDLKSELVRFRLIGPRSHALLMEALKPVFDFKTDEEVVNLEQGGLCETELNPVEVDLPSIPDAPRWWQSGSQDDLHLYRHSELLSESFPSIKTAMNPAQFTRGTVIGMAVLDPRLSTPSKKIDLVSDYYPPKKKTFASPREDKKGRGEEESLEDSDSDEIDSDNAMSTNSLIPISDTDPDVVCQTPNANSDNTIETKSEAVLSAGISTVPVELAYSPIWNPYMRSLVSNSKVPTHIINTLRSKQFVRSPKLNLGTKASKIPVLLLQQTLSTPSSLASSSRRTMPQTGPQTGCGWDLIIPSNWGREFWVALIYHGARACGMRELKKCSLEILTPHFPDDFPDTPAGQRLCEERRVALEEGYRRDPPDKRRNYGKLLICSPFSFPWSEIVSTWNQDLRINRLCYPVLQPVKKMKLNEEIDPQQEETGSLPESLQEGSRARKRTLDSLDMAHRMPDRVCALIGEWPFVSPPVYVLRSREVLHSLGELINHLFTCKQQQSKLSSGTPLSTFEAAYQRSLFRSAVQEFSIDSHLQKHSSSLVGVRIQMYQRGTLTERNTISMPMVSDFKHLLSSTRSHPHSGPNEELHPKGMVVDEGKSLTIGISSLSRKEIKEMKEERKRKLKFLKKSEVKSDEATVPVFDPSNFSGTVNFKLRPVCPSRETFGYVTSAGYRLTSSLYSGVGFCTFGGLLEAVSRCYLTSGVDELLALVRGESTQYWFVRLTLL